MFAVHGLSRVDFVQLLEAGTWTTFKRGATLQARARLQEPPTHCVLM